MKLEFFEVTELYATYFLYSMISSHFIKFFSTFVSFIYHVWFSFGENLSNLLDKTEASCY